MSLDALRLEHARRQLEQRYGLQMRGVTDPEVARALAAAETAGGEGSPEFWERCVDELPIDESCLFRDLELWAHLAAVALPPLLDRALAGGRRVHAVSLGCAAGQEPFSLAMLLLDLLRARGMPASAAPRYASIHGVDASAARVALAQRGLLNAWSVERAKGAAWLSGLTHSDPATPGLYRVDPTVTALTTFEVRNLLELPPGALAGADLVLCRHVLIYFHEARALELLEAIAAALDPGALLVVSSVEAHLLEPLGALQPSGVVGVARARAPHAPSPPPPEPYRPSPPPPAALRAATPPPRPPPAQLAAAAAHLKAGRPHEALRVARAVSYAQPENVLARLFIGQALLGIDPAHGRRVLEGLRAELAQLEPGRSVPFEAELTVGQLHQAVGLLLDPRSGR